MSEGRRRFLMSVGFGLLALGVGAMAFVLLRYTVWAHANPNQIPVIWGTTTAPLVIWCVVSIVAGAAFVGYALPGIGNQK